MRRQFQLPWLSFCPSPAKAVTSIMRYTGLLVAVLFLILLCFFQYPWPLYQGVFNDLSLDISGDMLPVINYVGVHYCCITLRIRDED